MMKKLAVPALMLAMAAFGCSSSTTSSGTGGSGGHATGGSATGGSHVGGSGGGGTSGGGHAGGGTAGGGAGGAAAGHPGGGTAGGGAGGAAAGHPGGGSAGGGAGGHVATDGGASTCTVTDATGTDVLTAQDFCTNLLATCSNVTGFTLPSDYSNMGQCVSSYGKPSTQQHCQSYHLCWGAEGITNTSGANPMTHCQHAVGMGGFCTPTDAGH